MSIEAREWAWGVPELLPSARLLLLALAEHVSEGATCFPGQSRLAAMCGISDRQVRSLLRELQARGLITVEHRPVQGHGRKSNVYRLELGNRKSATGNRNPTSAETEEGNGREEFIDTLPYPPVRGMPRAAKTDANPDHEAVSKITRPQSPAWARWPGGSE